MNWGVHPFVIQCVSKGVTCLVGGAVEHVKTAVEYIKNTLEESVDLRVVSVDMWVPARAEDVTTHRYKRSLLTFISKHPFPWKVCSPPTPAGVAFFNSRKGFLFCDMSQ